MAQSGPHISDWRSRIADSKLKKLVPGIQSAIRIPRQKDAYGRVAVVIGSMFLVETLVAGLAAQSTSPASCI